ncbi:ATP-binding cassette domain-containing protein [Streptomyces sp. SID5468]|nr:ATP-binding cassette domain-containing protein [Streptomyces sp. SID5468]
MTPVTATPSAAPAEPLRWLLRHTAGRTAVAWAVATAAAGATLALPLVLGHTLDLLLGRAAGGRTLSWTAGCAVLIAVSALLETAEDWLTATVTARGTASLRHRLLRQVLAAGPSGARFSSGDLVTRLVGNAADAGAVPAALATALSAVVVPAGAITALVLIDPWTAAAFLGGVPVLAVVLRAFARSAGDCAARYQQVQGRIAARLIEAVDGARTIAAAGTATRETRRILAPLPELSRQGHRMWRVQGRSTAQSLLVVPLLQLAVVAVAGCRLAAGALTVGEVLAVARYAVLATGIGVLVGQLSTVVRGRAAGRRLAEVLACPAPRHGTRELPPGDGALELRGVTVLRDGAPVLRDVDLLVPGGSTVAVVGRSGAGKSVLAAVAGRLIDPDGGVAVLDGVPLPELTRDELRRQVAYAFARPAPLGGTIAGTIAFGADEPPPERIRTAARAARADDFVRRLPAGYATACADAPLSGGELQRLGLARAFAHAQRLLILDDATSSLDTVTERQVTHALLRDVRARTRLVVAHRATTAAGADLVAWLDSGRLRRLAPHHVLWRHPDYRAVFAPDDPPTPQEPPHAP